MLSSVYRIAPVISPLQNTSLIVITGFPLFIHMTCWTILLKFVIQVIELFTEIRVGISVEVYRYHTLPKFWLRYSQGKYRRRLYCDHVTKCFVSKCVPNLGKAVQTLPG